MAENKINITGKLFASYGEPGKTAVIVDADQVAYTSEQNEYGNNFIKSSVKDEIDALKKQGTGSAGDITAIQEALAKKAEQSALDATNTAVEKAQSDATTAITNAKKAQDTADAKVASVKGSSAIIVDASTTTEPSVAIKLAETQGNVVLDTTNGLKASISADAVAAQAKVNGVAANDKFLTLGTDKLISAVASLKYGDAVSEELAGKKAIQLIGKDGKTVVSEIDASEFVKDGMISDVKYNTETHKITITWNTDAGKDAIELNLSDLVNTYGAGTGLKLDTATGTFSVDDTVVATKTWASEAFDAKNAAAGVKTTVDAYTVNGKKISVNPVLGGADITVGGESTQKEAKVSDAIKALEDKITAAESHAGVTAIDGKSGAFTVKEASVDNGAVNISVSEGKEISAAIVGLKSAAFTEASAYDTAGAAAAVDSKLTAATASLSKTISDNATKADTDVKNAKTELTGLVSDTKAELLGTGADDKDATIKRAEAKADAAQAAADEAKVAAKSESAAAITALGSASLSATAGTFITGVTVNQGKLTAVTSGSVAATQVAYSGSNVGASLDSIKSDVAAIRGTGTGSISSQIDAKINALDSTKFNTAASAGSDASAQVKVTVEQVDGKLNSVAVVAPTFALPADVTSAVNTAKTALVGDADKADTIKHAESLANAAQAAANDAKAAAEAASSTAESKYVKKAGDTMTGNLTTTGVVLGSCTVKYNTTDAALEFVFA